MISLIRWQAIYINGMRQEAVLKVNHRGSEAQREAENKIYIFLIYNS